MSFQMWQNKNNQTMVKEIRVSRFSLRLHTTLLLRRSCMLSVKDMVRCSVFRRAAKQMGCPTLATYTEVATCTSSTSLSSLADLGFPDPEDELDWGHLENRTQSRWPFRMEAS